MSGTAQKTGRGRRAYVPEPPPHPVNCARPDCVASGIYRAPKSRDHLQDYVWFCLDHIREYNRAWDYYAGMDQCEIERHMREDVVGGRPTWPLGRLGATGPARARADPHGFRFAEHFMPEDLVDALGGDRPKRKEPKGHNRRLSREAKALAILDLKPPVNLDEVKARYKALAKKLHPDANGGDRSAEERMKVVNQAYSTLKAAALD